MNRLANVPVFVRLEGRKAVLAGSKDATAWKAELLAAAGADVRLFSPNPSEKLAEIVVREGLDCEPRAWTEFDFEGAVVALLETQDDEEAQRFRAAARRAGAFVNVIDRPQFCDFSFGSIVERSPLIIGVSTDGAAPVFAQAIRARIEALFPDSLREWAQAARTWRGRLAGFTASRRRAIWSEFASRALASVDSGPTDSDYEAIAAEDVAGRLIIVGVGPGEADLLTLRAVRALQSADLMIEDGRIDPRVRDLARREAGLERWAAGADMNARGRAIQRAHHDGATVVVLLSGDGQGSAWEREAAQAGVVCKVVPGLASR